MRAQVRACSGLRWIGGTPDQTRDDSVGCAFVHGALRLAESDRLGTIVTALSDTGERDTSTGMGRR